MNDFASTFKDAFRAESSKYSSWWIVNDKQGDRGLTRASRSFDNYVISLVIGLQYERILASQKTRYRDEHDSETFGHLQNDRIHGNWMNNLDARALYSVRCCLEM
jgi:hypothetical protein